MPPTLRFLAILALAGAGVVVSACSSHPPAAPPGDMPEPPEKGGYVGLSKDAAVARAAAAERPWRIVREDSRSFPVTMDYRPERLNFTIQQGVVVSVTKG